MHVHISKPNNCKVLFTWIDISKEFLLIIFTVKLVKMKLNFIHFDLNVC